MYQYMWRTMTIGFLLSTLALSTSAQTSSNAAADPNKGQATSQAAQTQAPPSNAQANPAASNAQKNPAAQATKVQPGVKQPVPGANQGQATRTNRIQTNPNAVTQPNVTNQPAPTNLPGRTRTGVVDRSTLNAPITAPNVTNRGVLQNQSRLGERTAFRPQVLRGPDVGLWFNPTVRDGLVISDVVTTGPIARLGFVEGDRIVSVNGRAVATEPDFMQLLLANPAAPAEVVVFRNGTNQRIIVDPTILTQSNAVAEVQPLEQFGLVLDDRFNDRVVVWQVLPQSPAFYAGFRRGDVVTTLSGQPFRRRAEFENAVVGLRTGQANLQVRREGRTRNLTVDVPQFTRTAQRGAAEQPAGERMEGRGAKQFDQGRNNQGANPPQNTPAAPNAKGGERGVNR